MKLLPPAWDFENLLLYSRALVLLVSTAISIIQILYQINQWDKINIT